MFITAVCVILLIKLQWPKNKIFRFAAKGYDVATQKWYATKSEFLEMQISKNALLKIFLNLSINLSTRQLC